ncbi:MAG TPA: NnrS family protein [Gammaproteobacteria bacterium]|nr:NnrS family protein [Gammaproteobacteria bacterium]
MSLPLFNLGFRPFFLVAALFSALVMALWVPVYSGHTTLPLELPVMFWHGHEMVFGYAPAVLAGFLLTAVRNWTGRQTLSGLPLALLAGCWLIARCAFSTGQLLLAMAADMLFAMVLLASILPQLISTRQHRQWGLMLLLCALLASNLLFYLAITPQFSLLNIGSLRPALFTGLYLLTAIVILMIGRLLPAFTSMATDKQVQLPTASLLDTPRIILMLLFILLAPGWVAAPHAANAAALVALILALLHGLRLWQWRHREIAVRPLLWVIYLAYLFFTVGFAAHALQAFGLATTVATHAFAVGGVGLATIGLMARVALGHTGRDVYDPPKSVLLIILLLLLSAATRLAAPLLPASFYLSAVTTAQLAWILSFALFLAVYTPMLSTPRPDGKPG